MECQITPTTCKNDRRNIACDKKKRPLPLKCQLYRALPLKKVGEPYFMGLDIHASDLQGILHVEDIIQGILKQDKDDHEQPSLLHQQNELRYEKNHEFYGLWATEN